MPHPTYLCEAIFNIPVPLASAKPVEFMSVKRLRELYQIRGVRDVTLTQAATVKVRYGVIPSDDLFTIQNALCRFLEGEELTGLGLTTLRG